MGNNKYAAQKKFANINGPDSSGCSLSLTNGEPRPKAEKKLALCENPVTEQRSAFSAAQSSVGLTCSAGSSVMQCN